MANIRANAFEFMVIDEINVKLSTSDGAEGCPFDTTMRLYKESLFGEWESVAFNDDIAPGQLCSTIEETLLPGRYIALVGSYQTTQAIGSAFNLTIERSPFTE